MMISGIWLLLALLGPLGLALLLMTWPSLRAGLIKLAPWSALPALLMALLPVDFSTSVIPGLLLGSQIGLDDSSRYFLLLTSLVWLTAGLHARPAHARAEKPGFFILFLLAMSGNLGVVVAGDILSFYLSFALMSFAAYGLVIHSATAHALSAGRVYMTFVVLGEVMLLCALMLAASQAQSYDFETIRSAVAQSESRNLIMALTVMSLGIKIGLPGLHATLPLIYRAAPIPAAAVLAGAMINAGLLGWLRLLPAGQIALPEWSAALMGLGLFAAFYGVLVGLTQRDAKTLLAYSSISQMGILTFAVGLGLGAPQAWPTLLMIITLYAVHHGLAKAALFLGLNMTQHARDGRHWRWLALLGLALPALALAGAPFTSGMVAKALLKEQIYLAPWPVLLGWLLPLSSLATTLLVIRLFYLVRSYPGNGECQTCHWQRLSWALLVIASLVCVWFIPKNDETALLSLSTIWQSLWPVLGAMILFFITARGLARLNITIAEIPAGDLFVPVLSAVVRLARFFIQITKERLPIYQEQVSQLIARLVHCLNGHHGLASVEARTGRWPIAIILVLMLILTFILPGLLIAPSSGDG